MRSLVCAIFTFSVFLSINLYGQDLSETSEDAKNKQTQRIDESSNTQKVFQDTYFNVGVGFGINYGGIGIKTHFGIKKIGLFVGVGSFLRGLYGYEVGVQYSRSWYFINVGYGLVGTSFSYNSNVNEYTYSYYGSGAIMFGGIINLGARKKNFIEISVGQTFLCEHEGEFILIGLGFAHRFVTKNR